MRVRAISTLRTSAFSLQIEANSEHTVVIIAARAHNVVTFSADADEILFWADSTSSLAFAALKAPRPGERIEYPPIVIQGKFGAYLSFTRSVRANANSMDIYLSEDSGVEKVLIHASAMQLRSFIDATRRASAAAREMHPNHYIGSSCRPSGPYDKVSVLPIDSAKYGEYAKGIQKALSVRFHPDDRFASRAAEAILSVYSDGSAHDSVTRPSGDFDFDTDEIAATLGRANVEMPYGHLDGIGPTNAVDFLVLFGCRANLHQ